MTSLPLLMVISLVSTLNTFVDSKAISKTCKVQCDSNFDENENKEKLISVCHRGCELFTVALISTTQPDNFQETESENEIQGPKVLPSQIELVPDITLNQFKDNVHKREQTSDDSDQKRSKSSEKESQETNDSGHQRSKTTIEPPSQPVQDHPSEASEHSTTTNGPKRTQIESLKKDTSSKEQVKDHPEEIRIRLVETKFRILEDEESFPEKFIFPENPEDKQDNRVEMAKHSCRHACVTAYGGATEQEACVVGCHFKALEITQNAHSSSTPSLTQPLFKNPFHFMEKMFFNLAGRLGRLMRHTPSSSSSAHHVESTESIQVFGSKSLTPGTEVSFFEEFKPRLYLPELNDKEGEKEFKPKMYNTKIFKTEIFRFPKLFNRIISFNEDKLPKDFPKVLKNDHPHKEGQIFHHHNLFGKGHDKEQHTPKDHHQMPQQQLDLLECISRKSGLPRWFIATTIFASALVVLWLCFSLTAPPEDIRVVKTNVKPPTNERNGEDSEDSDIYDDDLTGVCSEKKSLINRHDDVIKIKIENV